MKQKKNRIKKGIIIIVLALAVSGGLFAWQRMKQPSAQPVTTTPQVSQYKPVRTTTQPIPSEAEKQQQNQDTSQEYTVLVENEEFKVRLHNPDKKYVVTLYAIINRPDQYEMYIQQLRDYKQHALQYMKTKGINTQTADITYEPQEAKDL